MDENALKELLTREDAEFRRAAEEHQTCERELEQLRLKSHPTEADAVKERDLKKRKLALKDRMYQIMQKYGGRP